MSQMSWVTPLSDCVKIVMIPALEDNYIFVIANQENAEAVVVDPATSQDVQVALEARGLQLKAILNTHHHWDHVGGNKKLKETWPEIKIYGAAHDAERIPGITHRLNDGDSFTELGLSFTALDVRGHTNGHLAYWLAATGDVFVGDTLFGCGSGKLFEGTPEQMMASLARLRELPESTRVWCAHEYTEKNARIAGQLGEKCHPDLAEYSKKVLEKRSNNQPTVPLCLGDERKANPFLRWDAPGLKEALSTSTDLDTFAAVRSFRDRF